MAASETPNPLLQPVPEQTAAQYYEALLRSLGYDGSLEIRLDAGGGRGKGVFAKKNISKGDVVLTERPLAAVQQLDSKLEVSTCSHCFKAVGTVEQHIGGKICCLINELSEATTDDDDWREVQDKVDKIQAAVNSKFLEGLLNGGVQLPLTDKVDMAQPVSCRGGCSEEFCSASCEAEAWARYHCLMCPVGAAAAEQTSGSSSSSSAGDKGKGKAAATKQHHHHSCSHSSSSSKCGAGSSSSRSKRQPVIQQVHGVTVNRSKLAAFFEHADESNDIFRVAAQVIASTIIAADTLLQQQAVDAAEDAEAAAAYAKAVSAAASTAAWAVAPSSAAAAAAECGSSSNEGAPAAGSSSEQQQQQQYLQPLHAAFLPFALGHKAPWWDVVAAEQDTQHSSSNGDSDTDHEHDSSSSSVDDVELRAQLRELAADSLALLKAALKDARFPQLFDLQLYGSLVGMFELNNLALAVPAPVARYKAMLMQPQQHGLDAAAAAAAAALQEVQPLLEALGDDADTPVEGTGFYALQSCVNHSCAPNAAASCLPNGEMIITALQDIPAGSEVVLSYIEEEGTGLDERRALLRDYGFVCACERCMADELAGRLEKQQLVSA